MTRSCTKPAFIIFLVSTMLLFISQTCSCEPQNVSPSNMLIDYGNGTIVRNSSYAPEYYIPPVDDPERKLTQFKDINITTQTNSLIRARITIPLHPPPHKMPILLHFHGGAFIIASPFDFSNTWLMSEVSARANVVAISIEYRMYPEYTIPAPFEDAWAALEWVAAHVNGRRREDLEPWVFQYGDLQRVFVGGDSAGGTIAHYLAAQAKLNPLPNRVNLTGLFLATPYFLGSKFVPFEPPNIVNTDVYKLWAYVCPECDGGVDNVYINPFGRDSKGVPHIGCKKVLVYTAEKDDLRGRGRWYYRQLKASGWKGEAQWIEAKGEPHTFHMFPVSAARTKLINDFSAFVNAPV